VNEVVSPNVALADVRRRRADELRRGLGEVDQERVARLRVAQRKLAMFPSRSGRTLSAVGAGLDESQPLETGVVTTMGGVVEGRTDGEVDSVDYRHRLELVCQLRARGVSVKVRCARRARGGRASVVELDDLSVATVEISRLTRTSRLP